MCKHAYENGKAECINGVIKNNYLKHWNIKSLSELVKALTVQSTYIIKTNPILVYKE